MNNKKEDVLTEDRRNVLNAFSKVLQREAHVLQNRPDLLWQQLYNRLQWEGEECKHLLESELDIRNARGAKPWLHSFSPPREHEAFQFALVGHEAQVNTAEFSPDGKLIATSSDDGTARIWDASSGQELHKLTVSSQKVKSAAFSHDSKFILTRTEGVDEFGAEQPFYSIAVVWDCATGQQCYIVGGKNQWVKFAVFSPTSKYVATIENKYSDDQIEFLKIDESKELNTLSEVRIWDTAAGQLQHVLSGNAGQVNSISFSSDDSILATTCTGDVEEGQEPTGRWIMTGVNQQSPEYRKFRHVHDSVTRLWSTISGQEILSLNGHKDGVSQVIFNPDGSRILTIGSEPSAILWDARTGQMLLTTDEFIGSPIYSPDGTKIISINGGKVSLWNAESGQKLQEIEGHSEWAWDSSLGISGRSAEVFDTRFHPSGSQFVTCGSDLTARIWDATTGEEILVLSGHTGPILNAAFSPNGERIVTASLDGTAMVWRSMVDMRTDPFTGHAGGIHSVVFNPNGQLIATTGDDRTICVWRTNSRELATTFGYFRDLVRFYDRLLFFPNGDRIATMQMGQSNPDIWNISSGMVDFDLKHYDFGVYALAISPDGEIVATGSDDFNARLWSSKNGLERDILKGHKGWVSSVIFDPTGHYIGTGSTDHTARIWKVSKGKLHQALKGHSGTVNMILFNNAGTAVATAGKDKGVRIWDPMKGSALYIITEHSSEVIWVSFSPDDRYIASLDRDGQILISVLPENESKKTFWRSNEPVELDPTGMLTGIKVPGVEYGRGQRNPDEFNTIGAVAFSQNGDQIIAVCEDDFVRVWDTATCAELASLPIQSVTNLSVSPTQPIIACGDEGGTLHVLHPVGIPFGPVILTTVNQNRALVARCPACQQELTIKQGQPGHEMTCPTPGCGLQLKINPFVIDM